jgi:WD40 repeat protein
MENFEAVKDNLFITTRINDINIWNASSFDLLGTLRDKSRKSSKERFFVMGVGFVNLSPDNTKLVSGSFDEGYATVWDLQTLSEWVRIQLRPQCIKNAFFAGTGANELITLCYRKMVVWNLEGELLRTLSMPDVQDAEGKVRVSLDYSVLVVARTLFVEDEYYAERGLLLCLDYESGELRSEATFQQVINDCAICPVDSNKIALVLADGVLLIWNVSCNVVAQEIRLQSGNIQSIQYDSGGTKLFVGTIYGTVFISDSMGELAELFNLNHLGGRTRICELVLCSDDRHLAVATPYVIHIVDIATSATVATFSGSYTGCWSNRPSVVLL